MELHPRLLRCVRYHPGVLEELESAKQDADCLALLRAANLLNQIDTETTNNSGNAPERAQQEGQSAEPAAKRARMEEEEERSRRFCGIDHEIIFAYGSMVFDKSCPPLMCSINLYNTFTHKWILSSMCRTEIRYGAMVIVKNMIYILGGVNDDVCRKQCFCFQIANERTYDITDKITESKKKISSMLYARESFAAGVIDERIIVAGGSSISDRELTLVETIDTSDRNSEWKSAAPMCKPREAPASCVFNRQLYVFGGKNGRWTHKDGERYNPTTDTWTPIAAMRYQRHSFGAAVFNGQIYVAGGCGKKAARSAVERYDPATDTWESLGSLGTIQGSTQLLVSCGKLFAIGGSEDCEEAAYMELYSPETNSWTKRKNLVPFKEGTLFGVLPLSPHFDLRI